MTGFSSRGLPFASCAVTHGATAWYCLLTSVSCLCSFRKAPKRVPGKYGQRYYKNVGLGFRTPKSAIEGALP